MLDRHEPCFDKPFIASWAITQANGLPPCITRVCAEARAVAFETGSLQHHPFVHGRDNNDWDQDDYPDFAETHGNRLLWVDSQRDRVLTHYTTATNEEIEEDALHGDPLQYAIHHAAHLELGEPVIALELIHWFTHFNDPYERSKFSRWSAKELAEIMQAVPSWTITVLRPIFVFAKPDVVTGLFGLLNDAPVQLVDLDDQDRLWSYIALGDRDGVTVSKHVSLDDIQQALVQVEEDMQWLFRSEHSMPAYRVALIFRLYTDEVHVERDKDSSRPIRVVPEKKQRSEFPAQTTRSSQHGLSEDQRAGVIDAEYEGEIQLH